MTLKGIDVSKHQGVIDWQKVKADGVQFAMLRVGYMSSSGKGYIDKYFEYNYSECKKYGIYVGGYIFDYSYSVQGAINCANFMLENIKGKQFEMPIAYDIEYEALNIMKSKNIFSKDLITNMIISACSTLEKAKYYVMAYLNTDFINNYINYNDIKRFDIWLAQWNKKLGDKTSVKIPCGIWQYAVLGNQTALNKNWATHLGSVNGINASIDVDYAYKNYPYIIKKYGLNGYGKIVIPKTYAIEANINNVSEDKITEIIKVLKEYGFKTQVKEEN